MRWDWFATGAAVVLIGVLAVAYLSTLTGCEPPKPDGTRVCREVPPWSFPVLYVLAGIGLATIVLSAIATGESRPNTRSASDLGRPSPDRPSEPRRMYTVLALPRRVWAAVFIALGLLSAFSAALMVAAYHGVYVEPLRILWIPGLPDWMRGAISVAFSLFFLDRGLRLWLSRSLEMPSLLQAPVGPAAGDPPFSQALEEPEAPPFERM